MCCRKKYNHYTLLNIIFIVTIVMILLYSAIFSPEKSDYPVPSAYTGITDNESVSTGLSHSFSEIIRLNFRKAHEYNPYGFRIFLFFLVQLFFKINFLKVARSKVYDASLITLDIVLSVSIFLIAFWPFLIATFEAIREYF